MTRIETIKTILRVDCGVRLTPNQAIHTADYIELLEQENSQLKELSLKLCDAVENNDDLPPIKYALKCGYLVNKLRQKAQDPE